MFFFYIVHLFPSNLGLGVGGGLELKPVLHFFLPQHPARALASSAETRNWGKVRGRSPEISGPGLFPRAPGPETKANRSRPPICFNAPTQSCPYSS